MYYLYKIINMLNNKVYIGQSNKEKERWRQHKYYARQEKPIQYIHRAMAKYGIENFAYEVIAACVTQVDTDEIETQLIKQYDSRNKSYGYNIAPGGNASWNRLKPEMIEQIITLSQTGLDTISVAQSLKIDPGTAHRYLSNAGIDTDRKSVV